MHHFFRETFSQEIFVDVEVRNLLSRFRIWEILHTFSKQNHIAIRAYFPNFSSNTMKMS